MSLDIIIKWFIEILFDFDFDELESPNSFPYGGIVGVRFASFSDNKTYNPIVDDDFQLLLTDITSICNF